MAPVDDDSAAMRAVPRPDAVQEVESDWVQLALAPFHYFGRSGYIRTDEEWRESFMLVVKRSIPRGLPPSERPTDSKIEWELEWLGRRPTVHALGMRLELSPDTGALQLRDWSNLPGTIVFNAASFDDLIDSEEWNLPQDQRLIAKWFLRLAIGMGIDLHHSLAACVKADAALIMARKNTILAPFERVWPDQWEYFQVNGLIPGRAPGTAPWYDPRELTGFGDVAPICDATGPNGEKLYSIHVAPGVSRKAFEPDSDTDAEQACALWLEQEIRKSPRYSSYLTRLKTLAEARTRFPTLTNRAFDRALRLARHLSGFPDAWKTPGPRKFLAESPAVENSDAGISSEPRKGPDK
jgi:hypothetical protein